MNILMKGFFYNGKGYAEGNRVLLHMLHRSGYNVKALPRDFNRERKIALTDKEYRYIRHLESTALTSNDIFLNRDVGFRMGARPDFRVNIGHTTFETDRIPADWVPILNKFDEVWVQCRFNIKTFRDSGVKVPLRFIPYFFDDKRYVLKGDEMQLPLREDSYKFLSVFQLCERKGYDLLIRAYLDEFGPKDDTALVIKVRGPDETPRLIRELEAHSKPASKRPTVHIVDRMMPTPELLSLYRACDAFVLPTRGEGWGRPIFEAMIMAMPTIATDWSGQAEYMNERNSYPVEVERLVRIKNNPDYAMYNGHKWAEPSVEDLRKKMRHVYEHRSEAKAVGKRALKELLEKYNMASVERKVKAELEKFRKR
ncbi:glycosyltransferase family 4 protein [Paenibacillus sp. GYB003]|uniref:glycosyltransferase family 4 protein n=1 Tax=Paenibacillus sp. GYB003 TaxID=2994392 RepID=UPI002F96E0C7